MLWARNMLEQFINYLSQHIISYIGVFIALCLTGVGLPIPEDIILLSSGYVTAKGFAVLEIMIPVAMVAILGGDALMYTLGRNFGPRVFKWRIFSYVFRPELLAKVQHFYERYGKRTIFVARFMPGLRAWIYIFAGTVKMKLGYFILMDFLAALISVPLFIWVGFHFYSEIEEVAYFVARIKEWVILVVVVSIVVILIRRWIMRKRAKEVPNLIL